MEQVVRRGGAVIMPFVGKKQYTVEDIMNLPDGQRAELFDGEMVMMATPSRTHQATLMWLSMAILQKIKEKGGKCEVYPAPFAVFIKKDNKNYVEPDVVVICDKDKLDEAGCHGTPDWAIEIVSPSSEKIDCVRKLALYKEAGVREYWIVNSMEKTVMVYNFEKDKEPVLYSFKDTISVGIYEDFALDFMELENYLDF